MGWTLIGNYFYAAPSTPGPMGSGWTDVGIDLASHAGDYLVLGVSNINEQYQGTIPTWSSSTAYGVGAVVWDPTGGGIYIYQCIVANTGFRPSTQPAYWQIATPFGGSQLLQAQWSSTTGTLTPVPGSPAFSLLFFSSGYYDEAGNEFTTLTSIPASGPTGAIALFIQQPAGYTWLTEVNFDFAVFYQKGSGIEVLENLYSCNGLFDHSAARGDVLKSLIGSMAGTVIPPGDEWHVFAGAYNPPTAVLTDADLRDTIKGDFRISRRDICNGVKGTFIPAYLPTNQTQAQPSAWRWTDFPPYQGNGLQGHPNYIAEDGGAIIWKEVRFGFCTSIWAVQRLAKIVLQLLRFQVSLHLACKLTAFPIQAGDTVTFIHARWAALANPPPTTFFVTQSTIVLEETGDVPALGIDLVLREHDPTIYEFGAPTSPTNQGEYSSYGSLGVI
jgi:hypothetical protein